MERDVPREADMPVRIAVGQAESPDAPAEAAGLEDPVLQPERGQRQVGLHQVCSDLERSGAGGVQYRFQPHEAAGGHAVEGEASGIRLEAAVEVEAVNRPHLAPAIVVEAERA